MDKNVYRSELESVRFTESGKAALTDALMQGKELPVRHRRNPWLKRGMAAGLAALLLIGTAAAVTVSLWDNYFGSLDQGQQTVVETLSGSLPAAVTSNGATMTPLDAFGAKGELYLMLEVEAPAGTTLPVLDEEDAVYWISGGVEPETRMRLETPEGQEAEEISYSTDVTCLEDPDPTDNKITLVVHISADQDLAGLTLQIPGLWKWWTDNTFTPVFTGDFAFSISRDMGEESVVSLNVDGVTTQTSWGPITLKTLELSPLGVRWSYQIDEVTAQAAQEAEQAASEEPPAAIAWDEEGNPVAMQVEITPSAPLSVVLKDGTEVATSSGFTSEENGIQNCSGGFPSPVDLSQVDHLLWGETKIPLR